MNAWMEPAVAAIAGAATLAPRSGGEREVQAENPEGEPSFYAHITELGGFLASGPCELTEITRRFGNGDYRATAYSLEPPTLRWEVIVKGVRATK